MVLESRLVPNMAGAASCDVGGSCEEDSSELLLGKVRRPISRLCVRAYTCTIKMAYSGT